MNTVNNNHSVCEYNTFKELPFSASIIQHGLSFQLAKLYQTINAYCYENKDPLFIERWKQITPEFYDFLFEVDMQYNDNVEYDYNKYIKIIHDLIYEFVPITKKENSLFWLAKDILDYNRDPVSELIQHKLHSN